MSFAATQETLQVWSLIRPPFTLESDTWALNGFSVELWDWVAKKLGYSYTIKVYDVFSDLLQDTESWKNDLSIGNISITSEREKIMDFSNPIFDSWLALMVASDSMKHNSLFNYMLSGTTSFIIIILILLPTFVYFNVSHKKLKKRWHLYILLYFFAWSSFLSYSYTTFIIDDVLSKTYNIATLNDKKVACIESSTAERFLIEFNIPYNSYESIDEIYTSLISWENQVLVHDYPVLLYKSKQNKDLKLVWNIFKKEKYWILYPKWSLLRENINIALLELQSEWIYDEIYSKYFWNE